MNTTRFILAALGAFVFIFAFEFLLHGNLLMGAYEATAHLWRPHEESQGYMGFMFASQFLQAFTLAFLFTRHYEGKGIGEGVRFGLYIGLLLVVITFGQYCYMPVPFSLIAAWMAGALIKCLGVGVVLALIYKKSDEKAPETDSETTET